MNYINLVGLSAWCDSPTESVKEKSLTQWGVASVVTSPKE